MSNQTPIDQIAERVERLLVRYEELQRTNALLASQVETLTHERDALKSRLSAARARVDALLERLPDALATQKRRNMKQLEVQIMGQSYLLGCPEGGDARLLEAVERVDTAMCKIRDAGKVRARDRIAVLAALNLAFDLSERPAAAAPVSADATGASSATATVPVADGGLLLHSLLERLDAALGEDGRLL